MATQIDYITGDNKLQFIIVPKEKTYSIPEGQSKIGKLIFREEEKTIEVNGVKYGSGTADLSLVLDVLTTTGLLTKDGNNNYSANNLDVQSIELGEGVSKTIQNYLGKLQTEISDLSDLVGTTGVSTQIDNKINGLTGTATDTVSLGDSSSISVTVDSSKGNVSGVNITATGIATTNITNQIIGQLTGISGRVSTLETSGFSINGVTLTHDSPTGTISATQIPYNNTNVGATLDLLGNSVEGNKLTVILDSDPSATGIQTIKADGKVYTIKQGNTEIAKFNIEKDSFVKEGTLVYGPSTGLTSGTSVDANESATSVEGKTTPYLKLVIKTTDNAVENYIYIKADQLVDVYTGSTGTDNTRVDITVSDDHKISATLHIAGGSGTGSVTGVAAAQNGVTKESYGKAIVSTTVTSTDGAISGVTVSDQSFDAAGAAFAAYTDATRYVDDLSGSGSISVTGTQSTGNATAYTDAVEVLKGVNVSSSGGKVSGVSGTGIYVDKAGAAAQAYTSAKEYTDRVISWTVID